MKIPEIYQQSRLALSFEVFPPKTEPGFEALYRTVGELAVFQPGFISVTYGAGGGTRSQTLEIARQVRQRFQIPATAHFTLVGSTTDDILAFLEQAHKDGIENIMALRGDPPKGQSVFTPVEGGLANANQLVSLIRDNFPDFGIGVAGYPEKHVECPSLDLDLEHLKRKVDAGAHAIFTQLFYSNEDFLRFRDRCHAIGLDVPIVPGLLPVLSLAQVKRITGLCGSKLPAKLLNRLEQCGENAAQQIQIGIEHCTSQCEQLVQEGIPGLHFYVLNRSDATRQILRDLLPDLVAPEMQTGN